jgi:hypothetical protein
VVSHWRGFWWPGSRDFGEAVCYLTQHGDRDGRSPVEELHHVVSRDHETSNIRDSRDSGCPGDLGQDCQLPEERPRSEIDVLAVWAIHSHLAVFDDEDARSRLPVLNEHMTLRGFEFSGEGGDVGKAGIIERREDRYASDLVGKIAAHADRVGVDSHPRGSASPSRRHPIDQSAARRAYGRTGRR